MAEWIMAIIELCNSALALGKTLKSWNDSQFDEKEKELLKAAAKDGTFQLVEVESTRLVFAGDHPFASDEDAAIAAQFLDAFIRLCNRGLVIHHGEEMFRLTGQGFDLARKLPE